MAHASTRPAPPWTLPSATAWCSCSRDSARRTRSWPPSRATTRRSTGAGRPGSATPPSCSGREAPRPPPTGSGYTGARCLIWGAAWPGLSWRRGILSSRTYSAARATGRGPSAMNPFTLVPPFVYSLAATLWPAQIDGHRRGRELLLLEIVFVAAAIGAGVLLGNLGGPRAAGPWGGRARPFAAAHPYVRGRGVGGGRALARLPRPRV